MTNINLLAVLIAACIQMGVGYFWYGPLFGKRWMALSGNSMESAQKDMGKTYGLMFVASLLTAYVLAHFVAFAGATSVAEGATTGFWAWLGFVATTMFTGVLFDRKPLSLYTINVGYHLVSLALMGALIAVVR